VTDLDGRGVTVTEGSELGAYGERNIILWADHRAEKEAEEINATGSVVLDYVGGRMSVRLPICSTVDFLILTTSNGGYVCSLRWRYLRSCG
jgi:ribulose kinase